jgi:tyrosine-protein kinase Etk/Wzc
MATDKEGVKISLRDFLFRYIKYLPLFIISVTIALLVAYVYLRYTVPLYSARGTLMIKMGAPSGRDQELNNMFFSDTRNNVSTEIEVLRSLSLAKRAAASLGLQKRNYVKGNVKTTLSYPESPYMLDIVKHNDSTQPISFNIYVHDRDTYSFDNSENPKYRFGQNIENGLGTFRILRVDSVATNEEYREHTLSWEPLHSAAFFVLSGLQISPLPDVNNILVLSYVSPQPLLGKDIINQLIVEYQKLNIEEKKQTTSSTINFINERLNLITRELGDVEKDLQNYKKKNRITDLGSQSQMIVGNLSDVQKQITQQEVRREIISYLQDYLGKEGNQFSVVPTSLGITEPTILQQISEYNGLQVRRETLLKTTTANNLVVKDIETQAAKVRSDIDETLRNLKLTAEIEIRSLRNQSREYNADISSVPIREKELLEITRQQGIKQSLYLFLLQKREESAISIAATASNSQVVDEALAGTSPIKPQPLNVKIIAVFLGLVFPVGVIYLREVLNDKINTRGDVTKVTDAPIFGEIGHADTKQTLLVKKNKRDVLSEQFRMIRTNMKYLVNNITRPVILVTSTFSGEGKSFISINCGAVMALADRKTVILEFDIRKPKIMAGLGLPKSNGITNFLVSNIDLESLPVPVPGIDNLFVIPCGPIPPNPAEILLNPKLDELFRFVKERFEVVIVDTPPVGLVSDAFSLSPYVDASLYIVRMGYTLKKQVHFIEELYGKGKLPNMGLLINDIKASSHYYSYGNYGGYGYGYSHGQGEGYFEDGNKKNRKWYAGFVKFFKG